MLNTSLIRTHFTVRGGTLYKRLADGTLRRMNTVREGRLLAVVAGTIYYGPDIAWIVHHGSAPMFPVFTLNGDPHDLSMENVVAARIKRLRYRCRETRNGFKHPLEKYATFNSRERCYDDWVRIARAYYAADHQNVRAMEIARDRQIVFEGYQRPKRASTAPGRLRVAKPTAPQYVPGFRHYWYAGQWVRVPESCHVADDYKARCGWVLAGAVRFAFNIETEMVEAFTEEGVLVPRSAMVPDEV